ncbi:cysteine proteinase [Cutaneotrichosporon oleaginosum]|uniref:Ubiquitin carboxyl-terminal hydrolase n=2 Tax=Cutaneotrichosporon oleaginosum TaxID=879819 RepID=A0A0J1AZM6_9TREE|nr:cysteine proteinase [Cutaneotrichosporon oleaginosum]KLT40789.1 cysteine proteinase [Cutaneotrichosporon oleaginosum]
MPSKWVPLEASTEVFTDWARPLGLPEKPLSFQDVWSLDEEMLSFVPQPVKAVLLLFPGRGKIQDLRIKEDAVEGNRFKGDVWYIKQQIPNACGSIGLLHALLNLPESDLEKDSKLLQFKKASLPLDAQKKADLLDETDFFSEAHTATAQSGQSEVPSGAALDVDNHFIAFVQAKNEAGETRLVELDGNRAGPFDCGPSTDLLRDTAKLVREKYIPNAEGDVSFSMIALAGEAE